MYRENLNEILLSKKPSLGIEKLIENGQIYHMIPEVMRLKGFEQRTPYHDKDVFDHTMVVLDSIEPELNLRMAALLHDISKPDCFTLDEKGRGHFYGHHIKSADAAEKIMARLGYDKDFINDVKTMIRYHYIKDIISNIKNNGMQKFIDDVGEDRIGNVFKLVIADTKGKAQPDNLEPYIKLRDLCNEYIKEKKLH